MALLINHAIWGWDTEASTLHGVIMQIFQYLDSIFGIQLAKSQPCICSPRTVVLGSTHHQLPKRDCGGKVKSLCLWVGLWWVPNFHLLCPWLPDLASSDSSDSPITRPLSLTLFRLFPCSIPLWHKCQGNSLTLLFSLGLFSVSTMVLFRLTLSKSSKSLLLFSSEPTLFLRG